MATITGIFRDASDNLRTGIPVKFSSETNPQPDALGVLTAMPVTVTTSDTGAISILLEQGVYLVEVGTFRRDKFRITVPDSSATINITTLMEAQAFPGIGINYRLRTGYLQLQNVDTSLWHTIRLVGQPGAEQIEIVIPGET